MSQGDRTERLKRQLVELERQLREKDGEVKRLSVRQSLDKDTRRMRLLEDRLRDSIKHSEELESLVAVAKDRESRLTYELDVIRGVINLRDHPQLLREADLEVRFRGLEQENRTLREELVGVSEKCNVFQGAAARSQKEADRLRSKLVQLDGELERTMLDLREVYRERDVFVRDAEQAAREIKSLGSAVDEKKRECEGLRQSNEQLSLAVASLEVSIAECRQDEEHARTAWKEGHQLLDAKMKEVDTLSLQVRQLSTQKQFVEEHESAAVQRLRVVEQSLEAATQENRILREQVMLLQARADEVEAAATRLHVADAERSKAAAVTKSQEEQITQLAAQNIALERRVQSQSAELEAAGAELRSQEEELQQLAHSLGTRLNELERERDGATATAARLQKELKEAQDKVAMLTVMAKHHQQLNTATAQATLDTGSASERLARLLQGHVPQVHRRETTTAERSERTPGGRRLTADSSDIALSPPTPFGSVR
jgi:chromosome segregation ATPase